MGSRSRMLALSSRSGSQNGRLSPYRGSSMGGGGVQSMSGGGGGPMPAALLEQKIQSQHMEIQNLLTENQRLAATQVALRQELAAAQQEMQRMTSMVAGMQSEKDAQIRSLMEKAAKLELELRATETIRQELIQARADCQKLHLHSQDLTQQVRTTQQELQRARADMQQIPLLQTELDTLRNEMQRAKTALEIEKKSNAEQQEQRQAMEQNLVAMARDLEKLRTEAVAAEKRSRVNTGGAVYNAVYNGTEAAYAQYTTAKSLVLDKACLFLADVKQETANGLQPSSTIAMESEYGKALTNVAKATTAQGVNNTYHGSMGTQDPYRAAVDVKVAAEEWATHEAPNGKPFYHNLITGTTQWEKPPALEVQTHTQAHIQPQVTNSQALQTAANQIIASHALTTLMNGQVQQNTMAPHVPQQQPSGATLITQHGQAMAQLGANGAQIPQGVAVGQYPTSYVGQQQSGVYLSQPGAITYSGAQLQMQQQLGSYVQHPGMVQAQAQKMQQAVAPASIQMQAPGAVQGAHVIAVSNQAPQTPAPAPMPHLVHGHLSYPGAGALLVQGPTHLANAATAQQQLQQQQQQQVQLQQQQQEQAQLQQQQQQLQQHQQLQLQQIQQQQQQQQPRQETQGATQPGQTPTRATVQTAAAPSAQTQPQAQGNGAQAGSPPNGAKLFVFGIPEDMGDKKLADLFTPFGTVIYSKVGVEKETGRNRTYGFVSMDSSQSAEAAINQVNGMVISGKRIKVELKKSEIENQNQQHQHQQLPHQHQASPGGTGPTRWNHIHNGNLGYRPY